MSVLAIGSPKWSAAVIAEFDAGDTEATLQAMAAEMIRIFRRGLHRTWRTARKISVLVKALNPQQRRESRHSGIAALDQFPLQQLRPYSITSSARARIEGGIVIPSVLAIFRSTVRSILVGSWTGRSEGLAP